jgi:hypothetical protein
MRVAEADHTDPERVIAAAKDEMAELRRGEDF